MTPIAVLDTSVAIDLYRGDLLDAFFQLPAKYMVPDIMYQDELTGWFGETLLSHGLIVRELQESEIVEAREFMRRCPSLSVPDAYALALATQGRHTMLAGARDMREIGTETGIEVRGVLHVFDMIEEAQLLSPASLHTSLAMVCKSRRVRLPQEEVEARYTRYRSIRLVEPAKQRGRLTRKRLVAEIVRALIAEASRSDGAERATMLRLNDKNSKPFAANEMEFLLRIFVPFCASFVPWSF